MNEPEKKIEFKDLIKRDAVKEKFEQMMGKGRDRVSSFRFKLRPEQ